MFKAHLPSQTVRHKPPLIPGIIVVHQNWMSNESVHIPSDVHQDRKRPESTAKVQLFPSVPAYHDFSQNQRKERIGDAEWVNSTDGDPDIQASVSEKQDTHEIVLFIWLWSLKFISIYIN